MLKSELAITAADEDPEACALVRDETDSGLLQLMAQRERDLVFAGAAFKELFTRHANYVWKVCWNAAEAVGGRALVEELFWGTMTRVFDRASRFELPVSVPADESRGPVLRWVSVIAANLYRSHLRSHGNEQMLEDEAWEQLADTTAVTGSPEPESGDVGNRQKQFQAAWDSLSEKEQLVLRTTYQFHRSGQKHQRLPNKVAAQLAETLGTTPENVRQIRHRALKQIEACLQNAGG